MFNMENKEKEFNCETQFVRAEEIKKSLGIQPIFTDEIKQQAIKEFAEKFWDKYHGDMKMGDIRLLLDRLLKEYGIGE